MEIKRSPAIAVVCLALVAFACKGKYSRPGGGDEESSGTAAPLNGFIRANDPAASRQLVSGFYGVENNAWRWTARKFSVALRPPAGADRGALLTLTFNLPSVIIGQLKPVTLTASVNGRVLKSDVYTAPGQYDFTAPVPPDLLTADSLKVDFALDKALPPSGADRRELGMIVSSVGLAAQ